MSNTMYFDYCDMDPMDYAMGDYDVAMAAAIKRNADNRAISEMMSMLLAIKNDKDSCKFGQTMYEQYKPLMFLIDMNPDECREWIMNAMFDFNFKKEYESYRENIHIRLIDKCLCVKQRRKEKQLERKNKKKNKEGS